MDIDAVTSWEWRISHGNQGNWAAKPSRLSWITAFVYSSQFCDYLVGGPDDLPQLVWQPLSQQQWGLCCVASRPGRSEGAAFPPQHPAKGTVCPSLSLTQLLLTGIGERVTVTHLSNYTKTQHRVRWATSAPVARKKQPGKGTLQLNKLLYPEMNWEPERGCTERPWP